MKITFHFNNYVYFILWKTTAQTFLGKQLIECRSMISRIKPDLEALIICMEHSLELLHKDKPARKLPVKLI